MSRRLAFRLCGALFALVGGCGAPTIPEGRFGCTVASECPAGYACVDARCRRAGQSDAGALIPSDLDADVENVTIPLGDDAGRPLDGSAIDATGIARDAGIDADSGPSRDGDAGSARDAGTADAGCATAADCDDYDPCTTDSCLSDSAICQHSTVVCAQGCCNAGACYSNGTPQCPSAPTCTACTARCCVNGLCLPPHSCITLEPGFDAGTT